MPDVDVLVRELERGAQVLRQFNKVRVSGVERLGAEPVLARAEVPELDDRRRLEDRADACVPMS